MFVLACAKCHTTTLGFGGCLMEPFQGVNKNSRHKHIQSATGI